MDLAFVEPFFGNSLHDLLAAAAQLSQIQFALVVPQFAIAPLLDTLRQIFGDMFLEPAQEQRTQFGRKPFTSNALGRFGVFSPWFIGIGELFLVTEVARLD